MLEFTLDNFTYGNEIVKYLGKWNYLIDPFTTHLSSEPTTTSEKTCGKVYALFLMTVTFSVSDAFFEIPPLEAVNYYHKAPILDVAEALDLPLPVEEPCIQQTFKGLVLKKS